MAKTFPEVWGYIVPKIYVYLESSKGSQVPKMAETLVKDFFFELPEEYGSRMPCFL